VGAGELENAGKGKRQGAAVFAGRRVPYAGYRVDAELILRDPLLWDAIVTFRYVHTEAQHKVQPLPLSLYPSVREYTTSLLLGLDLEPPPLLPPAGRHCTPMSSFISPIQEPAGR
jgi:hypothetical protein